MEEFLSELRDTGLNLLALGSFGVAIIFWRWSAEDDQGFLFVELRLFICAFLTAGLFFPEEGAYFLFWLVILPETFNADRYPYVHLAFMSLILIYWIVYSVLFYCARQLFQERSGESRSIDL